MPSRLFEIESEVVDMTDEDSDADEVEVAPARSHGEDVESEVKSVGPMTDMSDTNKLAVSEVSVDDICVPNVEVRDPQ